ncbi:MAG: FeoB-associated Cys-rich membrane protein [Prevotella bivia]|uniref:FeoB-associated Cys-rich membrane protein n=1 Tax=Prevotella bivia DNF00320 TaxID=1401068 RepID=A0A096AB06_9BACT|nr:hypothetical protein [Prevotella bivia]KGF38406.1 hypothetical protein HMPREF2136_03095 [Prevotella bivia DNF00650]KGF43731.1 hypothetical protein HMPREF0647_09120 [Prevotella bivia DNF00320]MDK7763279.1 FeoB-associated Cys-rich membrane protein [Prevotella bivia]MDU2113737.1 FeoB-associated Cys-rich membrane protein [Prevotella bivia]MDU5344562.1 FeoB-associated Cys-rich membrane protein [Prevotella bivia]
MWQYIIIGAVLGIAFYYAFKKIRETIVSANDPCGGCKGCAIHDKLKGQQKLEGRSKPICHSDNQ